MLKEFKARYGGIPTNQATNQIVVSSYQKQDTSGQNVL